jgi:Ca-activated chloride channel homolog
MLPRVESIHRIKLPVVLAVCGWFSLPAWSQQKSMDQPQEIRQFNAANDLVRQGDYDAALSQYRQIDSNLVDRDRLRFNQAVAHYRQGNIAEAESLFLDAASARNEQVAADSRFNLGNCKYARALQLAQKDKLAAIEQLRKAVADYRSSLGLRSNNPDARANIELATKLMRQLEQEQPQQPAPEQQQPGGNAQNQSPDQQQPDSSQPDSQNEQNQQSEGRQSGDQQQSTEAADPTEQQDPAGDQSSADRSQAEGSRDNPENQPAPSASNNSADANSGTQQNEPLNQPTGAQQPSQSQRQSSADQNAQTRSLEETKDAISDPDSKPAPSGELKAAQNAKSALPIAPTKPDSNAKPTLLSKEEAMKMLQAVRDRDMLRRLKQEQLERSRRINVDRDW